MFIAFSMTLFNRVCSYVSRKNEPSVLLAQCAIPSFTMNKP